MYREDIPDSFFGSVRLPRTVVNGLHEYYITAK